MAHDWQSENQESKCDLLSSQEGVLVEYKSSGSVTLIDRVIVMGSNIDAPYRKAFDQNVNSYIRGHLVSKGRVMMGTKFRS